MSMPSLVVHGGAWRIPDAEISAHEKGISAALEAGWRILREGGTALDAVETAVVVMEDDPVFDAGRGSILNIDGSIEMDASIMDGRTFDAGAVAALRNFPNPIKIARCIMEKTEHILLTGQGCEQFALKQGFHQVPFQELLTPRELKRLELLVGDDKFKTEDAFGQKRGTVGAVALDKDGNIAAATSTGGTPKKIPGRVGDTPLIGCGTFAENGVGGVSCTGWGEAIMKVMLAREVTEAIRSGKSAQSSAEKGIAVLEKRVNGLGGLICLNADGEIGIAYNTPRMARGYFSHGMDYPVVVVE